MGVLSSTLPVLLAVLLFSSPPASADSLIYDPDLDIYWMQDGNVQGLVTWDAAKKWAEELTYGGYDDWRLPTTPYGSEWGYDGSDDKKYNVTVSELGHLFYTYLQQEKSTIHSANPPTRDFSPFTNLQLGYYWFGTIEPSTSGLNQVWRFDFQHGMQFRDPILGNMAYAIAVRDAIPAPESSSALLFLAGLLSLCRIQHQRNR